ncbi:transposase [Methanothermococcus sp. SCGC AD-155-N22]|nr:transposase [Methanothermococcus sp. SCGC AD-155-N22]
MEGKTVIADKGYVSEKFAGEMEERGVKFIAIKRKNMIKGEEEVKYYRRLSKLRRRIETLFSIGENFGLRFIRAMSRRGLVVKIILSLSACNIYRYMVGGN